MPPKPADSGQVGLLRAIAGPFSAGRDAKASEKIFFLFCLPALEDPAAFAAGARGRLSDGGGEEWYKVAAFGQTRLSSECHRPLGHSPLYARRQATSKLRGPF